MRLAIAIILCLGIAGATAASAQTTPMPVPPPVSPAVPPAPGSSLSPILTQPWLAERPFRATRPVPAPQSSPAPVDQQKMQGYRNDLTNQRRALDQQGVSPGSERYREIQQQLNQLNGSSR